MPGADPLRRPENFPVVRRQLQEEAAQLQQLYHLYQLDRKFLAARQDARILYFIDSHDIKAFIDPDDPSNMHGFEIGVERLHHNEQEAAGTLTRPMQISLRHDQIMNGLLFDPSSIAGVLPSHGKELDRVVAHYVKLAADRLKLMRLVDSEINRIAEQARRFTILAKQQGDPDTRRHLVHFFQQHAPVLTAILRNDLDSPKSRLQALLTSSRIVAQQKIKWTHLGLPECQEPFAEIAPSAGEVNDVWSPLEKFRYRHNTARANVIDATALAHVQRLQNEMERRGHHHVRVLLVTRARTLLRAAIEIAGSHLDTVQIRHPRLLVLASKDAEKLDSTAARTLGTALQIYQAHLATLEHSPAAYLEDLLQVSTAFLQAWDSFETSRLAIEARWRGTVGTPSTDTEQQLFQELLNLFCNERDASSILSERMVVSFDTFGAAASQFLMSSAELRQSARLELVHRGSRVQIAPLATAPVGPIEVALWPGSPTEPARSALGTIARNLVSPAERYLVWSTALACAGQWRQAEIFAHGAQRMAELDGAGGPTLDEARLLRAEIRRLGAHVAPDADDSVPDDKQRYESAMVDLSAVSPVNRVRRIREEAGQVLEAVLRRVDIPGLADERMAECAAEIARTIDSIAEGANKARMIAMLLTLHLAAEHGSDVWPSRTASDRDAAYRSHRRLVQILEELHNTGQMDALPRRARALALVGFARFGADGSVMGSSDKAGLPAPGPGPRDVPDKLRGDLPDLIQGLTECPDAIARLLLRELRDLAEALARMHSPILLLTPIRLRRPTEYSPTVAPYVNDANDATKDVVTAVLEVGINASHIAPLERAIKALGIADARAREEGADRVTQFTLRTDLQYFRLLLLTLRPLHLRTKEAPSVVDAYQAIIADYPEATLPHCRLSLIADMCGEPDRAISTMRDALDRVDKDPFLNGPLAGPHWLQSLVRRRLAALMLPSAAQLRRCPGDGTTDGEMAAQVETLITACRLLRDAEQRDTARHCDNAHLMERRRRANNMVFYVSRLLEREGGREALNGLMLPYAIDGLVDELIPDGIEANEDPATLHTVGCYFAATGHPQDAYRAGKRIIDLVINNQQEMTGAHPADSMTEAMAWYRVGHPMTKSSTSETIMVSLST